MTHALAKTLSSRATRILSTAKETGSRGTCISPLSSVFRAFVFGFFLMSVALALLAAPAQSNVQLNLAHTSPREVDVTRAGLLR